MSNEYDDEDEQGPPSHWGAEVKDGKPVPYVPPPLDAKLHLSQVCMGPGTREGARAYLRSKVQEGPALVIASLREGTCENVSVDLVYDEYTEFSVEGDAPLHISGYFMYMADEADDEGPDGYGEEGEEDDSDEDMTPQQMAALRKMFQQGGGAAPEDDSDEDDDDDDDDAPRLIPMDAKGVDEDTDDEDDEEGDEDDEEGDDGDEEDDDEAVMAAAVAHRESTVVIEEITTEADPVESAMQKRKADAAAMERPQSSSKKSKKQAEQRQQEQDVAAADAALAAGNIGAEPASSQPKSKTEKAAQKAAAKAVDKAAAAAQPAGAKGSKGETPSRSAPSAHTPTSTKAMATQQKDGGTPSVSQPAGSAAKSAKKGVRTFPNGLKIETVAMGQPDGKLAKAGKRVKMKYVGRLASNGKMFDQTRGNKPFSFRLGVGEVISGWDKGIEGMRVGDKRKLTIPPSMGYGASGAPPDIPGNATLVFDVELVNVM